jgi:secreted PhoX family phosphatase
MQSSRREFLTFMGSQIAFAAGVGALLYTTTGCATLDKPPKVLFPTLKPTNQDTVALAKGLSSKVLIKWDDPINQKEFFGTNNDYLAIIKDKSTIDEYYLWVNHEYLHPLFVSGHDGSIAKTKEQVQKEQLVVGGSILKIKKSASGEFFVIPNHSANKRLSGQTKIPFAAKVKVGGKAIATGTFANCAGGITPWDTFLACEENYQDYYGEYEYDQNNKRTRKEGWLGWEKHFPENPEHYGWVVEIDPITGNAKKHVALGRFAHEGASPVLASDGRAVVYMGDDANDQCIYKFIASKPGSLDKGELFVADTINGKWLSLNIKKNAILKKRFKTQLQVMIRCREAAKLIGGTPLNRPEDVEIHPFTKEVYFTQTNNKKSSDFHGQISKIKEENDDPLAMNFEISTFVTGGEKSGFSCPDNLIFDNKANLWFTTDMSTEAMNKPPYDRFKNNGLFVVPTSGEHAGEVFQVASAPTDAEFTGPCFSDDFKTLFLSVQHPGEESKSLTQLTSHWPDGGDAIPRSAVIMITGPSLNAITG